MAKPGWDILLDQAKLDALTRQAGQLTAHAHTLWLDAKAVLTDSPEPPLSVDRISAKARATRWRRLYPLRELIHCTVRELRAASDRLDAQYEGIESELTGNPPRRKKRK